MFTDKRSKRIVLVSHCLLNQNSISDNTADFPGTFSKAVDILLEADIGIVQMPCPELMCLGLDRGDIDGGKREAVVENSRIRRELEKRPEKIASLVGHVVYQLEEYKKNGFSVIGIIGVNRSPSCGVETTSEDDSEVKGMGVFMDALSRELEKRGIESQIVGVKTSEVEKSLEKIRRLAP